MLATHMDRNQGPAAMRTTYSVYLQIMVPPNLAIISRCLRSKPLIPSSDPRHVSGFNGVHLGDPIDTEHVIGLEIHDWRDGDLGVTAWATILHGQEMIGQT